MMKLHPTKLGLTLGILWGAAIFVGTFWLLITGSEGSTWRLLGNFYLGFKYAWWGAFVGLAWGFVDGFICGWLIGLLYNAFLGKQKAETPEPAAKQDPEPA